MASHLNECPECGGPLVGSGSDVRCIECGLTSEEFSLHIDDVEPTDEDREVHLDDDNIDDEDEDAESPDW